MVDDIHPAVRIGLLLIGATAVSLGNYLVVAAAFIAVAFCYVRFHSHAWRNGVRLLKRMRWFFLSIVIVYFWFTPGVALFSSNVIAEALIPTYDGVLLGLHRVVILMLIIFMVNLLLQSTSQAGLLHAVYWWLRPLGYLGVDSQRVSVRISLVFSLLDQASSVIAEAKSAQHRQTIEVSPMKRLGLAIGEVIIAAEQRAQSAAGGVHELPEVNNPPQAQWLMLAAVIAAIYLLQFGVL